VDGVGRVAAKGGRPGYSFPCCGLAGLNIGPLGRPILSGITPGIVTYALVVTDSTGCTDSAGVDIFANPMLSIDAGSRDTICYLGSTQLNSTTAGGTPPYLAYVWSPTTGLNATNIADPQVNALTTTQTYQVNVVDSALCDASDTVTVWVNDQLIASAVGDSVCDGQIGNLNSNATGGTAPYSYQWYPSTFLVPTDISNPLVLGLTQTTTYTLVVTDDISCTDTTTATMTFVPLPQVDFQIAYPCFRGPNSPACVDDLVTLVDVSVSPPGGTPIVRRDWDVDNDGIIDFTGSSVSFSYTDSGRYDIKLIVTTQAGCIDSITKTLTVVDTPTARFVMTPDSACSPVNLSITDSSAGYILDYDWQLYGIDPSGNAISFFGSNSPTPNNFPTLPQGRTGDTTYYLALTVSNCCGSDTFIDSVKVHPLPIVNFGTTQDSGCSPLLVDFTLNGFVTVRETDSVVFDWGDGSPVQTVFPNPLTFPIMWNQISHVFVGNAFTDTTFFVTLYGYTACGVDSITKPILVKPNDVRAFFNTANFDSCEDLTVQVVDLSSGDSLVVSWCFDYDALLDTCYAPEPGGRDTVYHTYTEPGDYVIAQFVNNGCSYDTAFFTVQVRPKPIPAFMATDPCEGGQTQFTNLSTINDTANAQGASISGFIWDFDGLGSSSQQDPVFTFPNAGMYNVTLIAISDRNCRDTLVQSVAIWHHPDAAFTIDTVCFGTPNSFLDSSISIDGTITDWVISWGDSANTIVPAPFVNPLSHLYGNEGNYQVKLLVMDSNGCLDSTQMMATVLDLPEPIFTVDTVCEGDQTLFTDGSLSSGNGFAITQWQWDFGDGSIPISASSGSPQFHTYPAVGVYTANLQVLDSWGCVDSLLVPVWVDTLPVARFRADTVCFGVAMQFTDLSDITSNPIVNWQWDFGDGSVDSLQNPVHLYGQAGAYQVILRVEDSEGCSHLVTDSVRVYALPEAMIAPEDTAGCQPLLVDFRDRSVPGSGSITNWTWQFGDGNGSNAQHPDHFYTNVGMYTVNLLVGDVNGCQDDSTTQVEVYSLPTAAFQISDSVGCSPFLVQFTDRSRGDYNIVTWQWDFGDGQGSVQQNPTHTYRRDGIYQVRLVIFDENGCSDTLLYPSFILDLSGFLVR